LEVDEKELEQIIKRFPFPHISINEIVFENPSSALVIKNHQQFFDELSNIKEVYVI